MNISKRVDDLLRVYNEKAVQLHYHRKRIAVLKSKQKKNFLSLNTSREAMRVIQEVGQQTQQKTIFKIEELVSTALWDVFGSEGYDFAMELTYDKRSMSCEFYFVRDKEKYSPLECCEYGAVDVACFALRIAIWCLTPSRRTMILDEPFKNVSEEYRKRMAQWVRKVSDQLHFQFIISTHVKELSEVAQRQFVFSKQKGFKTAITTKERT